MYIGRVSRFKAKERDRKGGSFLASLLFCVVCKRGVGRVHARGRMELVLHRTISRRGERGGHFLGEKIKVNSRPTP